MARQFTARENGLNVTRWLAQESDLSVKYLVWACGDLQLYRVGPLLMLDILGNGTSLGGGVASDPAGVTLLGHDYINNLDGVGIPAGYRPNAQIGQIGWQHSDSCPSGLGDTNYGMNMHTIVVNTDGSVVLFASHQATLCNNYRQVAPLYWFINEDGALWGKGVDENNNPVWSGHKLAGQDVFLASLFGQSIMVGASGAISGVKFKVWGNICIAYQCGGDTAGYLLYPNTQWTGNHGLPNPLAPVIWITQYHGAGQDQGYPVVRNLLPDGTFIEYNGGGTKSHDNGSGVNAWGCVLYLTGYDGLTGGVKTLTDVHGISDTVAVSNEYYCRSYQDREINNLYAMNTYGIEHVNAGGVPSFPQGIWNQQIGTTLGYLAHPAALPSHPLYVSYVTMPDSPTWGAYPSSTNIAPGNGQIDAWDGGVYYGEHGNVHVQQGLIL
jgi:hypothetical protein